ncbi:hypothetical protein [Microbulbifer discodermiae]|uniref:hypothetical protein n=1 Tax=Microbulbifer sp. 2201CG32-9 TaxID=3232309 RepID=UPI00345B655B
MSKLVPFFLALTIGGAVIGGAYGFGVFSASFNTNLCYSEVILLIEEELDYAIKTRNQEDVLAVKDMLRSLPRHGYESDCSAILAVAKSYNKQRLRTRSAPQL